MAYFLCRLSPPRKSFLADMAPDERELMGAHQDYWRALADEGAAIAVGPVADPAGAWEVAILEAGSADAARALQARDPVIAANCGFHYETYLMPTISLRPAEPLAAVSSVTP
ncbi:MAG: YciI family protein [Roseiarcus sp.]